jgi:hypothetical protein
MEITSHFQNYGLQWRDVLILPKGMLRRADRHVICQCGKTAKRNRGQPIENARFGEIVDSA